MSLDSLKERGRAVDPALFDTSVRAGNGEDLALICYTSGTTGFPKGAMLSFRNLLTMALSLNEVDQRRESDEFVSFLPLAWIGEQMMSIATALAVGFTVNFPEEPETSAENIREIGPHVLFGPPRFWENLTSMVQVKIMDTTRFKRFMYQRWMPVGYRLAEMRFEGRRPSTLWRFLYFLAWIFLFRALKDRLMWLLPPSTVRTDHVIDGVVQPKAAKVLPHLVITAPQRVRHESDDETAAL